MQLSNCGVATSSDQNQGLEVDGVRYSHIVDPRTGMALTNRLAVTVVAPTAAAADAWGTAFSVLGSQKSIELADNRPGLDVLVVEMSSEGKTEQVHQSKDFPSLMADRDNRNDSD